MAGVPPNDADGMSQEDIDAMFAGGDAGGASAGDAPAGDAPAPSGDPAPVNADGAGDAGAADFGGFSQADIDAALAGAESADGAGAAETPAESPDGVFSQADIDAALADAEAAASADSSGSADVPSSAGLSLTNPDGTPKLDSTGKPFDETAAMMEAAIAEERAAAAAAVAAAAEAAAQPVEMPPPPAGAVPLEVPDLSGQVGSGGPHGIGLLNDVKLDVKIELGRSNMLIEDVLKLGDGSVVELDKLAGDPVDVLVNERLVARGEVLVLNDNFCVRINEILPGAVAAIPA